MRRQRRKRTTTPDPTNRGMDTNEQPINEGHSRSSGDLKRMNSKTRSPSPISIAFESQQYPPILHWPCTTQSPPEQSSSTGKQPTIREQKPISFSNPECYQQNHHLPHGQMFCLPVRPGSVYQPFTPTPSTDSSWQAPVVVGAAASGNESVPAYCYQGSYSHPPGFPGVWNPSAWWGHARISQPSYSYPFTTCPGGYNFFTAQPPTLQKGDLMPQEKLSQKHQRMWEAQATENSAMRAAITHMEAELAINREKMAKLEAEVSNLRREHVSAAYDNVLPVKTSKRGRPRKQTDPTNVLPPRRGNSQLRRRGRKATPFDAHLYSTEGPSAENQCKEEDGMPITCDPVLQEGTLNKVPDESKLKMSLEIKTISAFQYSGISINPKAEMMGSGTEVDRKTVFSALIASSNQGGTDKSREWLLPKTEKGDSGKNVLGANSQQLNQSRNVVRSPEWNCVGENGSEAHEMVGSGKAGEDEIEEDARSAVDDTGRSKAEFSPDPYGQRPSFT